MSSGAGCAGGAVGDSARRGPDENSGGDPTLLLPFCSSLTLAQVSSCITHPPAVKPERAQLNSAKNYGKFQAAVDVVRGGNLSKEANHVLETKIKTESMKNNFKWKKNMDLIGVLRQQSVRPHPNEE